MQNILGFTKILYADKGFIATQVDFKFKKL